MKHLERSVGLAVVLNYQAQLFEKGLAEATANRRLAAINNKNTCQTVNNLIPLT